MKYQTQRRMLVIGVGVVATLLSASCAITPKVDGPTVVAAGSSWTTEQRNSGSFGNGTTQVTGTSLGEQTEIGAQSVVSDVLAGKRALNLRQTKALARRFSVPMELLAG